MLRLLRKLPGRPFVQVALATAMLMAVVVVSGRPTVFYDTSSYYARGEIVGQTLFKPLARLLRHGGTGEQTGPAAPAPQPRQSQGVTGGRSVIYGAFLYMVCQIGALWLLAVINAVVAAWVIRVLTDQLQLGGGLYLVIIALLAIASSLPFYVGFAMPDLFAPVGVIATIVIALFWRRLGPWTRAGLLASITASLCFHTSHILLELVLIPVLAVILWRSGGRIGGGARAVAVLLAPVLIAVSAEGAYDMIVKHQVGTPPHRPPFLTARMLADGPARTYLHQACAQGAPYVLCRFRNLSLNDTQDMLWSTDPAKGFFMAAPSDVRDAIAREEPRFVMAALAHDPVGQASASLGDWGRQLGMIDVIEPLDDSGAVVSAARQHLDALTRLAPTGSACAADAPSCQSRFDRRWVHFIDQVGLLLSAALLVFVGWRAQVWRRLPLRQASTPDSAYASRIAIIVALLLFALIANAAITGVISGPFPRYSVRMVWLLPLAALITAAAAIERRGTGRSP